MYSRSIKGGHAAWRPAVEQSAPRARETEVEVEVEVVVGVGGWSLVV